MGQVSLQKGEPEDQAKDQAASVCSSESPQICCALIDSTLLDSSVVLCCSQCRAEGLQKVGKVTGALFDRESIWRPQSQMENAGQSGRLLPYLRKREENLSVCKRKATKIYPTKGYN